MRNVSLDHVTDATQLVCGVRENSDGSFVVVVGLKHPDGSWLMHASTPEHATEIGKTLLEGVEIAEGRKVPEPGEYETGPNGADAFEEFNHGR